MTDPTFFGLIDAAPAGATCMLFQNRAIAYGEVRDDSFALARSLLGMGLTRGDTAAIWLPNMPQWLVIATACSRIGVNLLPLNMRYGTREVGDFFRRSACKALFYLPHYRGMRYDEILCAVEAGDIATLRSAVALERFDGERLPAGAASLCFDDLLAAPVAMKTPAAAMGAGAADKGPDRTAGTATGTVVDRPAGPFLGGRPEDILVTFASSGTTSSPKLIQHPQINIWRHARDIATTLRIDRQSTLLLVVPFGGAFGYTIAISALYAGATLIVQEQFVAAEAAQLMLDREVTHMFGTDDLLDKILATVAPGTQFPALKMYGHANFTPALGATLPQKAASHGVHLRGCYGLSETMALFATQPDDGSLERRAASGGLPNCPEGKIRCRSLETGQLLPPGETGELEIWSPDLTVGYLGDPAATAKAFCDDGFLRTGDLGFTTPDGGMTLLSRIGDILRIGGYLVNPLEIEETVLGLCDASACQVVAIDVGKSVRPVAFVVGGPGYAHDERRIVDACRGRLATYKSPIRVFELEAFPVTDGPNGQKVKKNVLKDLAVQRMAQAEELS